MTRSPNNPNSHRNFVFGKFTERKPDTGYTKLCPLCSKRYALEPRLSGRVRDVELKTCSACASQKRTRWDIEMRGIK